ncbi:MFS transporter [Janibacter melonis]|uniref:MFS transporter n=1 Tax=Janibacter melonis TaxID=262209 RepID=UPI001E48A5D1|nr:MFS transporter [Janibacter melonis]MCB5992518.1 MFS transporter [Janibacter melonis]
MPSLLLRPASPARARTGVSLMFLTNGVLFSALLPRYPEIKAAFDLTNSQFGLFVVAFPMGALVAAGLGGRVIRRLGVLRTNAVGSVLLAVALAIAAASGSVWSFAAMLLLAGAVDALVDAAQNVQGVLVEQWRGRSAMNSFHALWSVGATTGGLVGATAAAAGVSISTQMVVNGAVWVVVALVACRLAVVPEHVRSQLRAAEAAPDADAAAGRSSSVRRHAWRLLVPFVVLAICGTLVEDVANNWAVLYLGDVVAAPTAVAGLGLSAALGAQFVGRVLGDPMTDRWGRIAVARAGGLLVASGSLLVVLAPTYVVALGGFAVAGFGSATLVPAAFAAAGRVPGLPEGTGIAVLGWLMRIGFLVTSPAIGSVADLTSLRAGLLVPVAAGLVAAAVAHGQRRAQVRI